VGPDEAVLLVLQDALRELVATVRKTAVARMETARLPPTFGVRGREGSFEEKGGGCAE
jgi:hypothetical protein